MSVGSSPSISIITDIIEESGSKSLSDFYRVKFTSGNAPTSGSISLGNFRNKTIALNLTQTQDLSRDKYVEYDRMGIYVSMNDAGDVCVVSAPYSGSNERIFIYRKNSNGSWLREHVYEPFNYITLFGRSTCISGDGNTVVSGFPFYSSGFDANWYFLVEGGYNVLKYNGSWSSNYTNYGSEHYGRRGESVSVDYDGSNIVVGQPGGDGGKGRVIRRYGTSEQTFNGSNYLSGTRQFGTSVCISGDGNTIAIGAIGNTSGTDSGRVVVLRTTNQDWILSITSQVLQSPNATTNDSFGYAVSLSHDGNTLAVTSPYEDTGATDSGAVYIFKGSYDTYGVYTWDSGTKIKANDPGTSDYLGDNVSLNNNGNILYVSSTLEDTGGTDYGSLYVFKEYNGNWTQSSKIYLSGPKWFSYCVSTSSDGKTTVVGRPLVNSGSIPDLVETGAAYIYNSSYFI